MVIQEIKLCKLNYSNKQTTGQGYALYMVSSEETLWSALVTVSTKL